MKINPTTQKRLNHAGKTVRIVPHKLRPIEDAWLFRYWNGEPVDDTAEKTFPEQLLAASEELFSAAAHYTGEVGSKPVITDMGGGFTAIMGFPIVQPNTPQGRDIMEASGHLCFIHRDIKAGRIDAAAVSFFRLGRYLERIRAYPHLPQPPAPDKHPLRPFIEAAWREYEAELKARPTFGKFILRLRKLGARTDTEKLHWQGHVIALKSLKDKRLKEWGLRD